MWIFVNTVNGHKTGTSMSEPSKDMWKRQDLERTSHPSVGQGQSTPEQ